MIEPPPLLRHVPRRALTSDHDAEQVDGHNPVEVRQIVAQEAPEGTGYAGVVEHDVEPAELGHGEVDHPLDLLGVGDVGLFEHSRRSQ